MAVQQNNIKGNIATILVLVLMDKRQYNLTVNQYERYRIQKHVMTRVEFGG